MYLAFLTVFLYIDLLCAETVEVHSSFPLEMSWKVFKICLFFFVVFHIWSPCLTWTLHLFLQMSMQDINDNSKKCDVPFKKAKKKNAV